MKLYYEIFFRVIYNITFFLGMGDSENSENQIGGDDRKYQITD